MYTKLTLLIFKFMLGPKKGCLMSFCQNNYAKCDLKKKKKMSYAKRWTFFNAFLVHF